MEAGKRSISDIFNYNRVLEIPFFQRSYVWHQENWDRFLDDMKLVSEDNKEYFLGSIILKQKETPSSSAIGDIRGLVDGQQRLTTLCIFFKELCTAQNRKPDFDRQFKNRINDFVIKHNHYDREIFEAILSDNLTAEIRLKNKSSSVLACHDYFFKNTGVLKEMNYDNLLNKIYFVGIDLGRDEDEQQIFDTINSLGVSLTTAELLKNELFRSEDVDLYENTWKQTFENEARPYWSHTVTSGRQRRENIDLLLQAYLSIESEAKEKYLRTDATFKNYKEFLKDKKTTDSAYTKDVFIHKLIEQAWIYKKNIRPNLTREAIDGKIGIERINLVIFGLNTTTIIPYIIYLCGEVADALELNRMILIIENFLIRRMVCRETTKNYNNLFSSFIRNKINNYQLLADNLAGENQTDGYPSDDTFVRGITESNLTNQQTRLFLYLLETAMRVNSRDSTAVLGLNEYSLEHILPKNWRKHWNQNLTGEEAKARDGLLLKLGNLTIIRSSLNSSIRDASWAEKKSGKGFKLGLSEHSKGIKIFDQPEFLQSEIWNEDKIKERNMFITQKALEAWPSFSTISTSIE